jgi:predicted nuclease with TOPRIM domain
MDAKVQEGGKREYTTPSWVQAWFLGRSRDNWKAKYKDLKTEAKRLKNRVNDVTRSREMWEQRAKKLEAENAALREQAALKKSGRRDGVPAR